jgi:hypothetical protein
MPDKLITGSIKCRFVPQQLEAAWQSVSVTWRCQIEY